MLCNLAALADVDLAGGQYERRAYDRPVAGPIVAIHEGDGGVVVELGWSAIHDFDGSEWAAWSPRTEIRLNEAQWRATPGRGGITVEWIGSSVGRWPLTHFVRRPRTTHRLKPGMVSGLPASLGDRSTWQFPRIEFSDADQAVIADVSDVWLGEAYKTIQSQGGFIWPGDRQALQTALVTRDSQEAELRQRCLGQK